MSLPVSPSIDYNLRLRCGGRATPSKTLSATSFQLSDAAIECDGFLTADVVTAGSGQLTAHSFTRVRWGVAKR